MIQISTKPNTKTARQPGRWLSPTSINAYLRCPRKFYYTKIQKLKQKPSIHLIRGIAVHAAIEKFYKLGLNKCGEIPIIDLKNTLLYLLRSEWESRKESLLELKLKPDEQEFFIHGSQKMILNFLHDFLKSKGWNQPQPVTEKTLFSKKRKVLARLDRIEKHLRPARITDFKTSKSIEVSPDYKRQMGICSLLYEEAYGEKPEATIHFLNFRDGQRTVQLPEHYLEELEQKIEEVHAKTKSADIKDYPCVCGWCDKDFELSGHEGASRT